MLALRRKESRSQLGSGAHSSFLLRTVLPEGVYINHDDFTSNTYQSKPIYEVLLCLALMPELGRPPKYQASEFNRSKTTAEFNGYRKDVRFGSWWDQLVVRLVFATACVAAGYHFHPFGLSRPAAAIVGLLFSVSVFLFEIRLQRASLRRLIGAAVGSILGIVGAYLMGLVMSRTTIPEDSRSFLDIGVLLVMTYIGLVLGARKGDMLNLQALGGLFGNEKGIAASRKFWIPA